MIFSHYIRYDIKKRADWWVPPQILEQDSCTSLLGTRRAALAKPAVGARKRVALYTDDVISKAGRSLCSATVCGVSQLQLPWTNHARCYWQVNGWGECTQTTIWMTDDFIYNRAISFLLHKKRLQNYCFLPFYARGCVSANRAVRNISRITIITNP